MTQISSKKLFRSRQLIILLMLCCSACGSLIAADDSANVEREQFKLAWGAAARGNHAGFDLIKQNLQSYILFPYLQYEDYRHRRARVPTDEMSAFLDTHKDWAFADGLRRVWLNTLAKNKHWLDFLKYSEGVTDTVLRCQRARGKIILKQTDGLLSEAQKLWAVGKSQPDECDPVFAWLRNNDGIPASLAWERIRLAMLAGNPRITLYLARYIPADQRHWLASWQQLVRTGYTKLERASSWPDTTITRMITMVSLQRLTRNDAALAAEKFQALDGHFNWGEGRRAGLLHAIALYSAVALEDDTIAHMARVPALYRDSQLLEWQARFLLSRNDWQGLAAVISSMSEETRSDERWRYWLAQAELRQGKTEQASQRLESLAAQASYYGFLAADELGQDYNICPEEAGIDTLQITRIEELDGIKRALELRQVQMDNWAVEEWSLVAARLSGSDLKAAAALAHRESWHDRAIFALGNSGDLRLYEWRFPLAWEAEIKHHAVVNKLDPAWVYGTIRAESAMLEDARSSANALGLMQLTPATGKTVAKKHGLDWRGSKQLQTAAGNLPLGTAYLSDLLEDYRHNPVLVSGAYNAGPHTVTRWLDNRPLSEAAIWIETLPYFETRDYIPRVLAFTTIYDWRLGGEVKRISSRMPHIESGKISINGTVKVACMD